MSEACSRRARDRQAFSASSCFPFGMFFQSETAFAEKLEFHSRSDFTFAAMRLASFRSLAIAIHRASRISQQYAARAAIADRMIDARCRRFCEEPRVALDKTYLRNVYLQRCWDMFAEIERHTVLVVECSTGDYCTGE